MRLCVLVADGPPPPTTWLGVFAMSMPPCNEYIKSAALSRTRLLPAAAVLVFRDDISMRYQAASNCQAYSWCLSLCLGLCQCHKVQCTKYYIVCLLLASCSSAATSCQASSCPCKVSRAAQWSCAQQQQTRTAEQQCTACLRSASQQLQQSSAQITITITITAAAACPFPLEL
jgi:hypothetical protein